MIKDRNIYSNTLINIGVALYLSALAWLPIINVEGTTLLLRYPIAILVAVLGLWSVDWKIRLSDLLLFCLIAITGFMNIRFVGNLPVNRLIYFFMSILISFLLMSPYVRLRHVKYCIYLNGAIILSLIMIKGNVQVYIDSSGNFVSVYAIYLASYYYAILENQQKARSIFPAVVTFIVCLFAEGRGGLLCSSVFLFGLGILKYWDVFSAKWLRYGLTILSICVVVFFASYFVQNLNSLSRIPLFSHFARNGFESNYRILMWDEYLQRATSGITPLLWGANYNETKWVGRFANGNPHNSFVDIHGLHGGITFIIVIIMIAYACQWAWQHGRWIYLLSFGVLLLRGFTDRMFWGMPGTPIFFFFLLVPFHWRGSEKSLESR